MLKFGLRSRSPSRPRSAPGETRSVSPRSSKAGARWGARVSSNLYRTDRHKRPPPPRKGAPVTHHGPVPALPRTPRCSVHSSGLTSWPPQDQARILAAGPMGPERFKAMEQESKGIRAFGLNGSSWRLGFGLDARFCRTLPVLGTCVGGAQVSIGAV